MDQYLSQYEAPLSLNPPACQGVVQRLIAFKTQLQLVQGSLRCNEAAQNLFDCTTEQPADRDMSAVSAQGAAEEDCRRAVMDLQLAAQKFDKIELQLKALGMGKTEKALLVPPGRALGMFSPTAWTKCFSEIWFADCPTVQADLARSLPSRSFKAVWTRKGSSTSLIDSDTCTYHAPMRSRLDAPEFCICLR